MARMKFVGEEERDKRVLRGWICVAVVVFVVAVFFKISIGMPEAQADVSGKHSEMYRVVERQAKALESISKTLKEINKKLR